MIKWLLVVLLLGVILYLVIEFVLLEEKIEVDEKISRKYNRYYIGGDILETRDKNYVYFGEIATHDGPKYVYKKYVKKYKFDSVNWEFVRMVLLGINVAVISIVVFLLISFSIASLQNSKRLDTLEHQRNYVETLNGEINDIVKSFMEHEEITFERDTSLEAIVITYPELRSVELVTNQLDTLKKEQQKLNQMELKIIEYEVYKKWLGIRK